MKILSTPLNYRYQGIIPAAKEVFDVKVWNPPVSPIIQAAHINTPPSPMFDFFSENGADIIFCDYAFLSHDFVRATKHLEAKLIVFGNMMPIETECDLICAAPSISPVMKKNLEKGYNTLYVPDFVDPVNDIGGCLNPDLESDIGFVCVDGTFNMDHFKLLLTISSKYQLKIIGRGTTIALPHFLGLADSKTELDFLKSVKIAIDFDAQNLLKLAANRIFTLSTIPNGLFPVINLHNCNLVIDQYIGDIHERFAIATQAQKEVLKSATSYHRLLDIVNKIELYDTYIINFLEERIQDFS